MTGTRLVLVAALLLALAGRAHAESAEAEVERLANEAVLAYKGADYRRAVELLTRAYDIRQVPALLYNMAKAYDKLGDVEHADDAYHKYVLSAAADPRLKAKAEARIVALDPLVKQKKEEEAKRAAEEAAKRAEEAKQAQLATMTVEKHVDPHEEFLRRRHRARTIALYAGAGTFAFAAVALSLSIDALVLQKQFSATTSPDVKARDKSDAIVRAAVADGFWAATAVGAAVTGYFLYRGYLQKEKVTVAPTASLSGGGLVVRGSF